MQQPVPTHTPRANLAMPAMDQWMNASVPGDQGISPHPRNPIATQHPTGGGNGAEGLSMGEEVQASLQSASFQGVQPSMEDYIRTANGMYDYLTWDVSEISELPPFVTFNLPCHPDG